ncbi:hypothetical protein NDU88_009822 [Pleurodeles waltl]|uniref:Uncharacterized protein n=1 Tax=Pleurodeles waltl TaxID=8319 RepID=A0AAV7QUM1_PLEWA|nr:hypothetical protein NDU88_009822 [Pleurodeles waltl]
MMVGGNPRWRPDFPADRHCRPSLTPDRTQLPLTRESRRCGGRRAPAARTAAGASWLSGAPARIVAATASTGGPRKKMRARRSP